MGAKWFRRGSWKQDKRAEDPCFVKNGKLSKITDNNNYALAAA